MERVRYVNFNSTNNEKNLSLGPRFFGQELTNLKDLLRMNKEVDIEMKK